LQHGAFFPDSGSPECTPSCCACWGAKPEAAMRNGWPWKSLLKRPCAEAGVRESVGLSRGSCRKTWSLPPVSILPAGAGLRPARGPDALYVQRQLFLGSWDAGHLSA